MLTERNEQNTVQAEELKRKQSVINMAGDSGALVYAIEEEDSQAELELLIEVGADLNEMQCTMQKWNFTLGKVGFSQNNVCTIHSYIVIVSHYESCANQIFKVKRMAIDNLFPF